MDSIPNLSELLGTNDPPPEPAIYAATEMRSKSIEDLRQIEADIELLKEKRNRIQKSIDTCNVILSPVRRLPIDVLREIFYHCLPTDRNPIMSATEAPTLLTQVSSLWRSIAFSSPRIWAKIHIPFPGDPALATCFGVLKNEMLAIRHQVFAKVIEHRCHIVKEWLHRSGTCPLSISLHYPIHYIQALDNSHNYHERADPTTDPLFFLVLSFSKRWRQLDLTLPLPIYQELEAHLSKYALPMLHTLRAVAHGQSFMATSRSTSNPTRPPFAFMEAPNLQQLYVNSSELRTYTVTLPSAVWNRLTHLCFIPPISDEDFYNLIQHCHNLITCEVQVEKPWPDNEEEPCHPRTDVVSSIRIFKLHSAGAPTDIFQSIYFPSLEFLHYRCHPRYQEFTSEQPTALRVISSEHILAIIENSPLTIRKLNIDPRSLSAEDTLECLRLTSETTHLSLGVTPIFYVKTAEDMLPADYLDFNLFAINTGCDVISFPKLEVLHVYDLQELTDETILRVLISRVDAAQRGDVSPLRHVKMQISRRRQKDIREAVLERAKSAGFEMKLDLQYEGGWPPHNDRLSPFFSVPAVDSLPKTWPFDWE